MKLNLDLTHEEGARLQAIAARQGVPVVTLVSKLVRQEIRMAEDVGARVAFGPGSLDTRKKPV